jgi:uncharacterized protein RhaS with RHS repeats
MPGSIQAPSEQTRTMSDGSRRLLTVTWKGQTGIIEMRMEIKRETIEQRRHHDR